MAYHAYDSKLADYVRHDCRIQKSLKQLVHLSRKHGQGADAHVFLSPNFTLFPPPGHTHPIPPALF